MDHSTWAILLLVAAVMLLLAEVFIPSGGLISILATVCCLAALYCAWLAWWNDSPGYFWGFVGSLVGLIPITIGVGFLIWPYTPIGKKAILEAPTQAEITPFQALQQRYQKLVGRMGITESSLNPAGIMRIDNERVHCQSEGVIIDPGCWVKVLSVQGNRVMVRPCELSEVRQYEAQQKRPASPLTEDTAADASPTPRDTPSSRGSSPPPEPPALDFEIT